jgi:hypothetical protein
MCNEFFSVVGFVTVFSGIGLIFAGIVRGVVWLCSIEGKFKHLKNIIEGNDRYHSQSNENRRSEINNLVRQVGSLQDVQNALMEERRRQILRGTNAKTKKA